MNPFSYFREQPRRDDWFSVGLTSSFPDVGSDDHNLAHPRSCGTAELKPGCKVFQVPPTEVAERSEVAVEEGGLGACEIELTLKDQVLVFQRNGVFYAIDNKCPHSSFPLSQGTPFDIEDFGVVLSTGLSCPKHGWSFDLFHGQSDRAAYTLKIWEVHLRNVGDSPPSRRDKVNRDSDGTEKEVWVRRKPRIG